MKCLSLTTVLILSIFPGTGGAFAEAIIDGDFGAASGVTGLWGKWEQDEHELGRWYAPMDDLGEPFYKVAPGGGHAYAAHDDKREAKLLQVVPSPAPGTRELAFEYRLTDPDRQHGLVRVYGVDVSRGQGNGKGKGSDNRPPATLKIHMDGRDIRHGLGGATARLLYDSDASGGLTASPNGWTRVEGLADVEVDDDYLVVYAMFSRDGRGGDDAGEWAAVRNISVAPEPTTVGVLVLGGLGLLSRRRD